MTMITVCIKRNLANKKSVANFIGFNGKVVFKKLERLQTICLSVPVGQSVRCAAWGILSVLLSICLSVQTQVFRVSHNGYPVRTSVYLAVQLSICLSASLAICLSRCLAVYLSVCLYIYLSVCLSCCLAVCLSVCLSVQLSICLAVCLSVCLSVLFPCTLFKSL